MPRLFRNSVRPAQNPLGIYLREIDETPLLSADEERELAYRILDGDSEARDHMVRANLHLVVNVARTYTSTGLGMQDLIEEGNLGLLRAVKGFDPLMDTRFSTYACYWIRQSIKRGVINSGKTVRLPAYMVELLTKWRRADGRLARRIGSGPDGGGIRDQPEPVEEEAGHHQEGHSHPQCVAARRSQLHAQRIV